jgi:type VI secretion system protein ImpC
LAAPAFRELEAAWRGIDGLCRNCPDEELVKTHVLDVSLEELAADPLGLSRLLTSESPDVLLVDHRFGASVADLNILLHLLEVCHAANVELAAGARPELAGCAHFAEVERPEDNVHEWTDDVRAAWASLRALRERGARLELALPRFVLRQPYGAAGEPLERLRFEEVEDQKDHEAFCWGNGAYLLVRALTIQHAEASRVRADGGVDVRELPIVHIENTEQVTIKPPAESWLSERSVGKLRAAGFAVLEGVRGTDRVIVHPAG